ncbi:MAG: head GIN domain-containing protein, partial [Ginsengibacter sp.]
MKYFLGLFFAALVTNSFGQTIINDRNAEVRNIGSFTGIKVSGPISVYLSQSSENALAVSASTTETKANIEAEVINGILVISYKEKLLGKNENRHLRVYISFKTLQSIEASGACDISIQDSFKVNTLRLNFSGACEMKGNMEVENMEANLSGASTLKISGKVKNLKLDARGASDLKNYNLRVENLIANLSGASDVKISITNALS